MGRSRDLSDSPKKRKGNREDDLRLGDFKRMTPGRKSNTERKLHHLRKRPTVSENKKRGKAVDRRKGWDRGNGWRESNDQVFHSQKVIYS